MEKKITPKVHPRSILGLVMKWHFILKLSPSYELAHLYRTGLLSAKEFFSKVAEPETVLNTYDDFGYTWNSDFGSWHKSVGKKLFRPLNASTEVKTIMHLRNGREVDRANFENAMWRVAFEREENGRPPRLILSVPLDISTKKALRGVEEKIVTYKKLHDQAISDLMIKNKPKYTPLTTKLRTSAINNSIKIVSLKITHPDWPLWKIGAKYKINPAVSSEILAKESEIKKIRSAGKRPNKRDNASAQKILINTLTSRFIRYGFLLAENAARGRFPSIDPILNSDGSKAPTKYDFLWMHEILVTNMKKLGHELPE